MPKKINTDSIEREFQLLDYEFKREREYQNKMKKQIAKIQAKVKATRDKSSEDEDSFQDQLKNLMNQAKEQKAKSRSDEEVESEEEKEDSQEDSKYSLDMQEYTSKGKDEAVQVRAPMIPHSPYLVFHYEKLEEYQLKLEIEAHRRKLNSDANLKFQKNKNKNLLKQLPNLEFYSQWNKLTPEAKQKYSHSYQKRLANYNRLKQQYDIIATKGLGLKQKEKKKNILSPYQRYYIEMYELLRNKSGQNYDLIQIVAIIKNSWNNLSPHEQAKYITQYEDQKSQWERLYGEEAQKRLIDEFNNTKNQRVKAYKQKLVLYCKQEDLLEYTLKQKYDLRQQIMVKAKQLVESQKLKQKHKKKLSKLSQKKKEERQMQKIVQSSLSKLHSIKMQQISQLKSKKKDQPTIPYDTSFATPSKYKPRQYHLLATGHSMEDESVENRHRQEESSYELQIYEQQDEKKQVQQHKYL